ncbi:hypothetical protein U1Q18_006925 [Sarracenia purpurea var. burkii]
MKSKRSCEIKPEKSIPVVDTERSCKIEELKSNHKSILSDGFWMEAPVRSDNGEIEVAMHGGRATISERGGGAGSGFIFDGGGENSGLICNKGILIFT